MTYLIVELVDGVPDTEASYRNMRTDTTHDGQPIAEGYCEIEVILPRVLRKVDIARLAAHTLNRITALEEQAADHEARIEALEGA